jgi:hypothetical protein
MVARTSTNAQIKVLIKVLEEIIEDRAKRGSSLKNRSTGIFELRG